jgi:hypothetical protein
VGYQRVSRPLGFDRGQAEGLTDCVRAAGPGLESDMRSLRVLAS